MILQNLPIVESSAYCPMDQYIEINQITQYMQQFGQNGDWYRFVCSSQCIYNICYTERNYTENGIEYTQQVIPFNELPQYVLDYLQTNNYIHIDR